MAIRRPGREPTRLATSRIQESIYKDMAANWALRLVLEITTNLHDLRKLTTDRFGRFVGVQDQFEDLDGEPLGPFTARETKRMLKIRLNELEEKRQDFTSTCLGTNIGWIAARLKLGVVEQRILAYAVMVQSMPQFRKTLELICTDCSGDQLTEVLSCMLKAPPAKTSLALSAKSPLIQSGLLKREEREFPREYMIEVPDNLCKVLLKRHVDVESILQSFFREASPARLDKSDFSHLSKDIDLLCDYLSKISRKKFHGVNILLYGNPGVGKSEFARLIAKSINQPLYEVACANDDGEAINGQARFASFMLTQKMLAPAEDGIILFDEIEDVFPSSASGLLALLGGEDDDTSASPGKAWVNRVLETNPVPAIWITNSVGQIDPAYLRRFDYAVEFHRPPKEVRRRIAQKYLSPAKTSVSFIEHIAGWDQLAPSQIETAARVARITAESAIEVELLTERILTHSAKLLGQSVPSTMAGQSPGYDLRYLNTNTPTATLIAGLKVRPSGTFCLHGLPGTGKTAFARHLADSIGKPLIVKRASDLLSKWLGESEQNIAGMFKEAKDEGAVLLLDEADSLLADRRGATQSWEVTQVNELLTQMESFSGIFICTTNLLDRLDQASLRRFAFKIRFDCLTRDQRRQLFNAEMLRLAPDAGTVTEDVGSKLDRLDKLTPGDFSAVARQWALWATQPSAEALVAALGEECKLKSGGGQTMGFTA